MAARCRTSASSEISRGRRRNRPQPRAGRSRSTASAGGSAAQRLAGVRFPTCALYTTSGPAKRGRHHPLVRVFDLKSRRFSPASGRIDAPSPSLISRANRVPIRANCGFSWRIGAAFQALSTATARPAENLNREADLSTEQACTQAPSRFPRAHGHQRRTQGRRGPAFARAQAAFRLRARRKDPQRLLPWND